MELAIRTVRSVAVVSTGSWIIVNILNGHHPPCPFSSLRIIFNTSQMANLTIQFLSLGFKVCWFLRSDLQWLGEASMRSWDREELKPRTFDGKRVVFSPFTFATKKDREYMFCFCSVLQVKLCLIYTKTMCDLLLDL